jgi:hypothetical protein
METVQEDVYTHKPLSPGQNIRLLDLERSADFASEIRCRLVEITLAKARNGYVALSYTWGGQIRDSRIICDDKPFYVTTNCATALRYLRKRSKWRILWVDAICIDQSSNDERGHQVDLMGAIYQHAYNVIVWLGEAEVETQRAFTRARNFHRLVKVSRKFGLLISEYLRAPSAIGTCLPAPVHN